MGKWALKNVTKYNLFFRNIETQVHKLEETTKEFRLIIIFFSNLFFYQLFKSLIFLNILFQRELRHYNFIFYWTSLLKFTLLFLVNDVKNILMYFWAYTCLIPKCFPAIDMQFTLVDVRYFSKGFFPWLLPMGIFPVATFQMCKFPSSNFPSLSQHSLDSSLF